MDANQSPQPTNTPDDQLQPTNTPDDQPQPSAPTQAQPAVKKRQSRPLLFALLLIIVAILGGLATYLVMDYLNKPEEQAAIQPATETTPAPVKTESEAEKLLKDLSIQISAGDIQNNGSAPGYQVDEYEFATYPFQLSPSLSFERSAEENKTTEAAIVTYFKTKDFTEKIVTANNSNSLALREYTKDTVRCAFTQTYASAGDTTNPVKNEVACMDSSEYSKLASSQKPFYEAFRRGSVGAASTQTTLMVGDPDVKDSQTAGYKLAQIGVGTYGEMVGGSGVTFYQLPDSQEWHYFRALQSLPTCDEYNTPDLKKAYLGDECLDVSSGSRVKVTL